MILFRNHERRFLFGTSREPAASRRVCHLPDGSYRLRRSAQAVASSNDETVFRCYRYALCLTPVQSRLLARASDQARRAWNELCALLDWAEREQQFGRREVLLHAYGRLLDQKKRAGKAITKAHRLMERHQLPYLDAAYAFAATSGWRMYAAG